MDGNIKVQYDQGRNNEEPADTTEKKETTQLQFRIDAWWYDLINKAEKEIRKHHQSGGVYETYKKEDFVNDLLDSRDRMPQGINKESLKDFLLLTNSYKQGTTSTESLIRSVDFSKGQKDKTFSVRADDDMVGRFSKYDDEYFSGKFPSCMKIIIPLVNLIFEHVALEDLREVTAEYYQMMVFDRKFNDDKVFIIVEKIIETYSDMYFDVAGFHRALNFINKYYEDNRNNADYDITFKVHEFLLKVMHVEHLKLIKQRSPKTEFKLLFDLSAYVEFLITPSVDEIRDDLLGIKRIKTE